MQVKSYLQKIYETNRGSNNIKLNTSVLIPGTYIVQIHFNDGSINSLKIIKQQF